MWHWPGMHGEQECLLPAFLWYPPQVGIQGLSAWCEALDSDALLLLVASAAVRLRNRDKDKTKAQRKRTQDREERVE